MGAAHRLDRRYPRLQTIQPKLGEEDPTVNGSETHEKGFIPGEMGAAEPLARYEVGCREDNEREGVREQDAPESIPKPRESCEEEVEESLPELPLPPQHLPLEYLSTVGQSVRVLVQPLVSQGCRKLTICANSSLELIQPSVGALRLSIVRLRLSRITLLANADLASDLLARRTVRFRPREDSAVCSTPARVGRPHSPALPGP